MWIGLLFAIMCSAMLCHQLPSEDSGGTFFLQPTLDHTDPIQTYHDKITECLVLANYTKSPPYTIETLCAYLQVEVIRSQNVDIGNWILLGMIVRLALRMGYHRDASHFPRISPFHAEMRRRVWLMISQFDVIASAQIGLPRMISESQSDTAEPRNLLDEDFDENMVRLPSPRPDTVMTPVQYFVAMDKVASVFGRISDLTTSPRQSSYAEVMRLDGMLHNTWNLIPHGWHMRPMAKSIMDSPDTVMRRIFIANLFHKAKCVLHRKYLVPGRTDRRYTYSRTACLEAALNILQCQKVLDQETQVGGRLHLAWWKASSMVKPDFLLATTILCLDLDQNLTAEPSPESLKDNSTDTNMIERVIEALKDSYLAWQRSTDSSREAQKVVEVLRVVLGKAQKMSTTRSTELGQTANSTSAVGRNSSPSSTGTLPFPSMTRLRWLVTRQF